MRKLLAIVFFGAIFMAINSPEVKTQNNDSSDVRLVDDDVYTKQSISEKGPMPYREVREADVMWSKKIWQMIDCRKKQNQTLYFPTEKMDDRISLIQLLEKGIKNDTILVFDNEQFKGKPLEWEQVEERMTPDPEIVNGDTIEQEVRYDEFKKYMIREQWYFDSKYSDLRVRVVGIAPIREWVDEETGQKRKSQVFWAYYPAARSLLADWEVFNRQNDAQRISFDDYFQQRRFNSFVVKESNVYENRRIDRYTTGINTLLEAREVRNEIFEFEHDLWEY